MKSNLNMPCLYKTILYQLFGIGEVKFKMNRITLSIPINVYYL